MVIQLFEYKPQLAAKQEKDKVDFLLQGDWVAINTWRFDVMMILISNMREFDIHDNVGVYMYFEYKIHVFECSLFYVLIYLSTWG
jgi:hypothetical protein